MQPSPLSTKQRVTVSLPTPLIERLRNEAPGQVCPDVPPQPGVQKFARPPPGIRRTDTMRSAPRSLATHRTESPPQNTMAIIFHEYLPFMHVSHAFGMANSPLSGPDLLHLA